MADIQVSRQTVIAFPDDSVTLTEGIMDASLSVSEILLSKHIAFGELNINKFEVDLHTDRDVVGKKIYVYQNVGTSVVPIFTGYVQSSKLDDFGEYRHLVAYDLFYTKGVLDIADWWDTYWESNEVSTLGALLRNLLSTFSIPYTDKVLLNDSMSISKTQEIASMKLSDMLKLICEANLCNPNINRQGVLEFVTVYNATEKSVIDNYEWNNSDFEDYELMQIGVVQIWNEEGHIGVSVGSGTNCLAIKNNFFFYGKETSELNTLATSIYNSVHGLVYKPASIKLILQDPNIKVGDMVRTSKGVSLVTEIDMSGAMLIEETLKSNGEEIIAEADSYNPVDNKVQQTQKQIAQVGNSVVALNSQVQELFRRVTNKYLLPFGMVLDEVTDIDDGGTPNNVLMFRYTSNSDNNSLTVHAEFNFNVHTFEKEIDNVDYFQDALITCAVILDETNRLIDFVEYMRDGWHTLVLDYLIGSAPSGTHDIYVAVQSQGASLYSMKVVTGYISALGTAASGPKQFYNIADMSSWIQTVANFCTDNFVGDVNIVTIQTQSNQNIYERIYRAIRVDPAGNYKITFDVQVVEDFVNSRGVDNFVGCQVGFSEPNNSSFNNNLWAQSNPFPTQSSDNYTSFEFSYNNNDVTTPNAVCYANNYIIFNFSSIPINTEGKFNIRNLKIVKTNSDLQFIDWESNLYVWTGVGSNYGKVWFKTSNELDAVILRGCGGTDRYSSMIGDTYPIIITSENVNIANYISEYGAFNIPGYSGSEIEFKHSITLSNGRIVYVYTRKQLLIASGSQIFYSETLYDVSAGAKGGSYDVYTSMEDSTHYKLSYELDDYLCERWGEPI